MKRSRMRDRSNIVQLKIFREMYGFTQDELAILLNITRAQLSMAESLLRSLPPKAEEAFIHLQNMLKINSDVQNKTANWTAFNNDQLENVTWLCRQRLIAMEFEIMVLKKDLAEMKKLETIYRNTIDRWERISIALKEKTVGSYNITNIQNRTFSKLKKCALSAQLEKELQIKIFSAEIGVLKQFMTDNNLA